MKQIRRIKMTDIIITTIISIFPSIAAVITIICAIIKVIRDNKTLVEPLVKKFNDLQEEVHNRKDVAVLNDKIESVMEENRQLKKEIADLITVIRQVKYDVNKEV